MTDQPVPSGHVRWWHDHKADAIPLTAIAIAWIIMIVLVNPLGEFPLNDEWIYARGAQALVESGDYRLIGPTIPNSLSAILWGALFCLPFGFSFAALRFSTLTLALAGVLATYALIRENGGTPRMALVGALTVAVNPVYFNLSNTFMTDSPFLSLFIIALYFLVRGLRRQSAANLVIGVLVSFAAVLTRQVGLFLLLAFAAAYPIRNGFRPATVATGLVPVVLGALLHFGYQRWLTSTGRGPEIIFTSMHDFIPASIVGLISASIVRCIPLLTYVGFFLAPFVLACPSARPSGIAERRMTAIRVGTAVLAALFLAAVVWTHHELPSLGNVLIKSGLGPLALRDTFLLHINDPVIPPAIAGFWMIATAIGVAASWSLILRTYQGAQQAITDVIRRVPGRNDWLYVLILCAALSYWAAMLVLIDRDHSFYDRYLLFFIPLAVLLVVCTSQRDGEYPWHRTRLAASLFLVVVYAGFSVAATHDFLAWNQSRWAAVHYLSAEVGVPPDRIDGGYEFGGWVLYKPGYHEKPGKSLWWIEDDEYLIASGPVGGYRELRRYPIDRWLPFLQSNVIVLHRS